MSVESERDGEMDVHNAAGEVRESMMHLADAAKRGQLRDMSRFFMTRKLPCPIDCGDDSRLQLFPTDIPLQQILC